MRRLPALFTIGFAVVTACGKWPDPAPQGGGTLFGVPIPNGDDAGDCGSTCSIEQTCLSCGGVSACATYGSTCCDTTVCGPESTCVVCGNRSTCEPYGSTCCDDTTVCGPETSCLECPGEPAGCAEPGAPCQEGASPFVLVDAGNADADDAEPICSTAGHCVYCAKGNQQCIDDSTLQCESTGCARCYQDSDCPNLAFCSCAP